MKVLFISGPGVEDIELWYPYLRMKEEGFDVVLASPGKKDVTGKYGMTLKADAATDKVRSRDFDALVLPGGHAPEIVRMDKASVKLVREFAKDGKPIAALCHGPQVLLSAGLIKGRRITSWPALQDDMRAAGARWEDREVVIDGNLVTSRAPKDLPAFCREAVKMIRTRTGRKRKAA